VHGTGGARIIEARDPLGVSVDQRVRIELSSGGLIGASFLAYIVPIIAMFIGVVLGYYLPGEERSDTWAGLGAVAGLGVGVLVSRVSADWLARRGKITPTITAIVAEGDMEER